jgi:predicted nucleic acid-binding protein
VAYERYAIDTNVFVRALRDRDQLDLLKAFHRRAGARVAVAAVVAMELRAGARTDDQRLALEALLSLQEQHERTFAPSAQAYLEAGRVLASLPARARASVSPSFVNDALLAGSCRELNVVLITNNARDFVAIQKQMRGFRFVDPWPLV